MAALSAPKRQMIAALAIFCAMVFCSHAGAQTSSPHEIKTLHLGGYVDALAWNADGSRLAATVTNRANACQVWNTADWTLAKIFNCPVGIYGAPSLSFDSEGRLLTPGGFGIDSPSEPASSHHPFAALVKWDVVTGAPALYVAGVGANRVFTTSSDGALIAGIGDGPTLYDGARGKLLRTFAVPGTGGHPDKANSVALSPGGHELAVGTLFGNVHFYRTSDGTLERSWLIFRGEAYRCEAVAYSPDGKLLAVAKYETFADASTEDNIGTTIWRVSDGALIGQLIGSRTDRNPRRVLPTRTLSWSPKAGEIAVGDDGGLHVWHITGKRARLLLEVLNSAGVQSVSYSSAGLLAAASHGNVVIYK